MTGEIKLGRTVRVTTDQKDADGTYKNADPFVTESGTLSIHSDGKPVAWYAAGKWIKVEFLGE